MSEGRIRLPGPLALIRRTALVVATAMACVGLVAGVDAVARLL